MSTPFRIRERLGHCYWKGAARPHEAFMGEVRGQRHPKGQGPAALFKCLASAKAADPFLGPGHRLHTDRLARLAEVARPRQLADVQLGF